MVKTLISYTTWDPEFFPCMLPLLVVRQWSWLISVWLTSSVQKLINNFVSLITNHNLLLLLECMSWLLPQSFDYIKLTLILKWIFHSPDALRLSIILPKYGLIFPRYCLIDVFLLPLLLHSIYLSLNTPLIFSGS